MDPETKPTENVRDLAIVVVELKNAITDLDAKVNKSLLSASMCGGCGCSCHHCHHCGGCGCGGCGGCRCGGCGCRCASDPV